MLSFNGEALVFIYNNPLIYVEFGISLILLVISNVFVFRTIHRTNAKVITLILSLSTLLCWFFSLTLAWAISLAALVVCTTLFYVVNTGAIRPLVSNTLKGKTDKLFKRRNNSKYGPIFDKEELYDKIEATVRQLSKTSTGGLITFERNTELTDYAKSGTILNAPVSSELLVTIFYPGTRLHDGAVIIRRDQIYAAACYFDPITTGLTGKYGSRHRAALGISKATDAVTIVVSEETGRVSLAVAGELIHVALDDFRRIFEEYMASEAKEKIE